MGIWTRCGWHRRRRIRHWTQGWNQWFKWCWHVISRYNTKETNEENIEESDEDEDIEGTTRQLATDDEDDVEDNDEDREKIKLMLTAKIRHPM